MLTKVFILDLLIPRKSNLIEFIFSEDHDGKISPSEAKFFEKAENISIQQLKHFWEIADSSRQGFLTPREFSVMCRLISAFQNEPQAILSHTLIQNPPKALAKFYGISNQPPKLDPPTTEEIQKYDQLFLSIDPQKTGFVDG